VKVVRLIFIISFCGCLLLVCLSAHAQTAAELNQKFPSLDKNRYLVRPEISLTVTFDENDVACRMKLDPQESVASSRPGHFATIAPNITDELLEEFAPVSKRGKMLSIMNFYGGCCAGVEIVLYENFEISKSWTKTSETVGITSAGIIRRKSSCWEAYQRESPE
jgi:hypothetical protein